MENNITNIAERRGIRLLCTNTTFESADKAIDRGIVVDNI